MKYFVSDNIRNERLNICRDCEHYFKLTGSCKKCGCFMRIKTTLSFTECPIGLWVATKEIETPKELPKHLQEEVEEIWEQIKDGKAKDFETKSKLIELYNTIYGTTYKATTNCSSCLASVFKGIQKFIK